jgi:DNA-binding MarR family transcriptional regulator
MNETQDQELRAHENHHASLRLWLRLLSCTTLIEETIRQKLREKFDITLSRFDLMAQLERHREGLTMGELSRRMMVSGGNITVIVDQLENEELVQRKVAATDRRSFRVLLTASGRKSFARMAVAHEQWVVDLFSGLDEHALEKLNDLLGHLKTGMYRQNTNSSSKETT